MSSTATSYLLSPSEALAFNGFLSSLESYALTNGINGEVLEWQGVTTGSIADKLLPIGGNQHLVKATKDLMAMDVPVINTQSSTQSTPRHREETRPLFSPPPLPSPSNNSSSSGSWPAFPNLSSSRSSISTSRRTSSTTPSLPSNNNNNNSRSQYTYGFNTSSSSTQGSSALAKPPLPYITTSQSGSPSPSSHLPSLSYPQASHPESSIRQIGRPSPQSPFGPPPSSPFSPTSAQSSSSNYFPHQHHQQQHQQRTTPTSSSSSSKRALPLDCQTDVSASGDASAKRRRSSTVHSDARPSSSARSHSLTPSTPSSSHPHHFPEPLPTSSVPSSSTQLQQNPQSQQQLSQSQAQRPALLSPSQKRANHIQSEQKRRANIRKGYEALCEAVPALREAIKQEESGARAMSVEDDKSGGKGGKAKRRKNGKGSSNVALEEDKSADGRAGPRSENVVLTKTIEHLTDLLSERSNLLHRLHYARSALGHGHPASTISPSHLDDKGTALWDRQWGGGSGWVHCAGGGSDGGDDGEGEGEDEE